MKPFVRDNDDEERPFFFEDGPAEDLAYKNVRDHPHSLDTKKRIEHLWTLYRPYADQPCRTDAKAHFYQRTWEVYLGALLRMHGFELHKVGDEGPEFFIEIEGRKVWIEAVAPGPGEPEKADSVPPRPARHGNAPEAQKVPEKQTSFDLRRRSARNSAHMSARAREG